MAATIWNGKVKRQLFIWLPKIKVNDKLVGYYAPDWTSKPPHLTVKEWHEVCEQLLTKLVNAGLFVKTPKSSQSLNALVQHVIAPQNNPLFRQTRSATRFAAYHAGFMEMTDIVDLENRAREKHGLRNTIVD